MLTAIYGVIFKFCFSAFLQLIPFFIIWTGVSYNNILIQFLEKVSTQWNMCTVFRRVYFFEGKFNVMLTGLHFCIENSEKSSLVIWLRAIQA